MERFAPTCLRKLKKISNQNWKNVPKLTLLIRKNAPLEIKSLTKILFEKNKNPENVKKRHEEKP